MPLKNNNFFYLKSYTALKLGKWMGFCIDVRLLFKTNLVHILVTSSYYPVNTHSELIISIDSNSVLATENRQFSWFFNFVCSKQHNIVKTRCCRALTQSNVPLTLTSHLLYELVPSANLRHVLDVNADVNVNTWCNLYNLYNLKEWALKYYLEGHHT